MRRKESALQPDFFVFQGAFSVPYAQVVVKNILHVYNKSENRLSFAVWRRDEMVKTAVCDDQIFWCEALEHMLQNYTGAALQVTVFQSGEQLLACGETFEVIFLDIDLTDAAGDNGIETARKLRRRNRKAKIIYLTNYADYSMEALTVHAFAYLLKSETLEFVAAEGLVRVKVSDILYFEYQQRRVKLTAQTGEFMLKKRIADVAQEMEHYDFAAPHKSFVVNLFHVKAIRGTDVVLSDETRVPLSQKRAAAFRRTLNAYLGQITGGGRRT